MGTRVVLRQSVCAQDKKLFCLGLAQGVRSDHDRILVSRDPAQILQYLKVTFPTNPNEHPVDAGALALRYRVKLSVATKEHQTRCDHVRVPSTPKAKESRRHLQKQCF